VPVSAMIKEHGLTGRTSAVLPRQVRDKLILVAEQRNTRQIYVWFRTSSSTVRHVAFDFSDDFPTELDIARLCIECP
jgi:hypothetical protein